MAIIISNARDPNAGTATVSINLAKKIRIKGMSCDLFFKEDIISKPWGVLQEILFAFILPFRHALTSYDILDINAGDGFFLAFWFRRIRHLRAPVLVARSHGLEHVIHEAILAESRANKLKLSWKYPFYRGGYRLWQVKKYLQCADLTLFLNSYDRDFAINRLRVDPSRARIVDVGLPDIFIGRPFDRTVQPQIKIAIIGTFIERKGIEYAVPALNTLLQRNDNLSVGFLGPRVSAETILARFSPELWNRIEVIEQYEHNDLPGLLSSYRILLFASLAEGFGLVSLEAMACGLASVVTKIPGVADRLINEVNALIIPPHDQKAIQDSIQRLIDDPELLLSLRHAGHILAQNFSWARVADDTLRFYDEGIERRLNEVSKRRSAP